MSINRRTVEFSKHDVGGQEQAVHTENAYTAPHLGIHKLCEGKYRDLISLGETVRPWKNVRISHSLGMLCEKGWSNVSRGSVCL